MKWDGVSHESVTAPAGPPECGWCSNGSVKTYHYGPCPRVESIEYHPNGTVKCVKFRDA